jgi:hypothetical protein
MESGAYLTRINQTKKAESTMLPALLFSQKSFI